METLNLAANPRIKSLIKRAFPKYNKREAQIRLCDRVKYSVSDVCWDEGSKTDYAVIRLSTGQVEHVRSYANPLALGNLEYTIDLDNDMIVVETGYFMGKPVTARVHCKNGVQWTLIFA